MTTTTAPSLEALNAITDRINSGTEYSLAAAATYGYQLSDDRSNLGTNPIVTVVHKSSIELDDRLDAGSGSQELLQVFIRSTIADQTAATIAALDLLVTRIIRRLKWYRTSDNRVQVWECGLAEDAPDYEAKRQVNVFQRVIEVKVEVAA